VNVPRFGMLALTVALAVAGSACVSGSDQATTDPTSPSATAHTAEAPSDLPNPFTVVARFSATSLGLENPSGALAIGRDGNLYVPDAKQRIVVISPEGKVLRAWGSKGSGPGQFHFVSFDPTDASQTNAGIAIGPHGDVYVVDSGNSRVEVFSRTGAFIRQFGDDKQFTEPGDVAVDPSGNTFVADIAGLAKFSPTGTLEWRAGGPASTDLYLQGPLHLASIDPHGRVVAGTESARGAVWIDQGGHRVDAFTVGNGPSAPGGTCDATLSAQGFVFIASCGPPQATILAYDRTHRLVGAWFDSDLMDAPRFAPNGDAFAVADDGSILRLKVALPDG
jgi:hypothetical protein